MNLVGSFGLSCASYWWTWITACGLRLDRLIDDLLGPDFPLDMLLYPDDLESMGRAGDSATWATRSSGLRREVGSGGIARHAWSSAVQGKAGLLPAMGWLADQLEGGGRLQRLR